MYSNFLLYSHVSVYMRNQDFLPARCIPLQTFPLQVRVCCTFKVIKMFPKQMLLCVTLEDSETDLEPRGSPSWSYLLHLAVQVLGVSMCLCVHTVYMYCMSKSQHAPASMRLNRAEWATWHVRH